MPSSSSSLATIARNWMSPRWRLGESWYGQRAIDRNLVDEVSTSDEYLMAACDDKNVFEVSWIEPKKPMERIVERMAESAILRRALGWLSGSARGLG